MKKLLCTLLCVMLIVTMMPTMVFAEDVSQPAEDVETWLVYSDKTLAELNVIAAEGGNQADYLTDLLWMEDSVAVEKYLYTAKYTWSEEEECHSFSGGIKEVPSNARLEFKYGSGEDRPIAKDITAEHIKDTSNKFAFTYHQNEDGENPQYDFYTYFDDCDYGALVRIKNAEGDEPGEDSGDESGDEEYHVSWSGDDGLLRIFNDQGKVNVPYEANADLAEAEGCDLGFELGIWAKDEFFPLDCQMDLFEMKTDDETGETWLQLDPAALAEQVKADLEDNNEAWIYFRPIVTEGEESYYINDDREILLIKSSADFDYYMDNEQFLLPGEQFGVRNEVRASVRNAQFPDWEEFLLEVTDVSIKGGDGIAQLTQWEDECGWNVRALKTGDAVLKITHENYIDGGESIIKEIPIHAVDDLWRTDVDYVDREKEDGKLKVTLMANARHQQYSRGEITETGEDYQVVWDLDDPDEAGAEIISEENETVIVTCDHVDRGFSVYYDIYEADAVLTDESVEPVDSGERWIHMDNTFYTFELNGFEEELGLEETMELEGRVVRHFMDGEEPAEETAEAEFGCWEDGGDSLDVESKTGDDGVFRASVTRRAAAGTSLWLEAHYADDDIWWNRELTFNEVKEGVSAGADVFYGYTKDGSSYVKIPYILNDWLENVRVPEFYRQGDKPDEFYILWPEAENAERPSLSIFEVEGYENTPVDGSTVLDDVTVADASGYTDENGQKYFVWKIAVGDTFDMARVGITLSSVEDYTYYLWILGEDYRCADIEFEYKTIFAVPDLGTGTWDSVDDLREDCLTDKDGNAEVNLNMSLEAKDNSFYILHRNGIGNEIDLTQLYAYVLADGTGGSIPDASRFEKTLNVSDVFAMSDSGTVAVGNKTYFATKFTLKKYLGHNDLFLTVGEPNEDYMRARITFGINVIFEGATEGIISVNPTSNLIEKLFDPKAAVEPFEKVYDDEGNIIGAYFRNAFKIFDNYGQGRTCSLAMELVKPEDSEDGQGYAVSAITGAGGKKYNYIGDRTMLYYLKAEGSNEVLDTWEELFVPKTPGNPVWHSGIGTGDSSAAVMTLSRFATYGFDSVGWEIVSEFKDFLVDENYKPLLLGGFDDYTVYFPEDTVSMTSPCSLVVHVEAPNNFRDENDPIKVQGGTDIEIDATETLEYDEDEYNSNVVLFYGEDHEVKKVYDITETKGELDGNGMVCISISETELDGGNLEDYTVVYFTEAGVPVEVETTYVEGQGLVFTTGHFSNYAVIGKISESGGTPDETYGAAIDGVYYATLEEALSAALNTEDAVTVTLMKDAATKDFVSVPENAVLDLNGHKLEAEYFACFGNIVDNSEENTGVLVSDNVLMQKNNKQLPIKNDEGNYQFFEVTEIVAKMMDSESPRYFASSPKFERFAHSLIAKGSDVSGLSIIVKVKAEKTGADEYVEQDFVYSDKLVKGFVDSYTYDIDTQTGTYNRHFKLTINNIDKYENITCQVVIKTAPGVELKSDIVAYK